MCGQLLTTPLPEVLQKDGSIAAFQQLLQDIANPTALAEFDPEIFKAALTGSLLNHLHLLLATTALHPPHSPELIMWHLRRRKSDV